jgi:lycopene beta-cyclase
MTPAIPSGNLISQLPVLPLLPTFLLLFAIVGVRYLFFAGAGYYACLSFSRSRPDRVRRISAKAPSPKVIRGEIYWSLLSSAVFAASGVALVRAWQSGHSKIYDQVSEYGIAWFLLSPFVLMFLHDTWFYWTHRWMHLPSIFRRFHEVHHRSRPPTAWAAFSFHPLEAIIEAVILPLLVLIIPTHWSMLLFFLTVMTILSVINHLGYETYPRDFATHWFFRYWVSATHHQIHHERVHWNYGLYFNLWDHWMGTEHPGYAEKYRQLDQERLEKELSRPAGPAPARDADVIIVGAGLSGSLLAARLTELRPEIRLLLLESEPQAGGNHTWSFHHHDISPASLQWLAPWVSKKWDRHEVRFPSFTRLLNSPYYSIRSEDLHRKLEQLLGPRFRPYTPVESLHATSVKLVDGTSLQAACVIDARGWNRQKEERRGYQKFVGLNLQLQEPHGLHHPVLMEVGLPQGDHFRFIYLLPWSEDQILIEDTFYSDTPELDVTALADGILQYARNRDWKLHSVLRTEKGCLPIPLEPLHGSQSCLAKQTGPVAVGTRAGLFHDTTGYSLPYTVKLIDRLTGLPNFDAQTVRDACAALFEELLPQRKYLRLLNNLLFQASRPSERYQVLQHFYRLSEPLIHRFYAGMLTRADRTRILMGRPPVPVLKAVQTIIHHNARSTEA